MITNQGKLLEMAVEITKEYARSGEAKSGAVQTVLEEVFNKLVELNTKG